MTDWYTEPREGRTWLLGNGTILDEPVMEASGSKRRARIFGRQETAVSHGERHAAMMDEVRRRAKQQGTYPWMALLGAEPQMHSAGCSPEGGNADLFAISPISNTYPRKGKSEKPTRVYWTFRHPTLPITAQVVITAETVHSTRHTVGAHLSIPNTCPDRLISRYHKIEDERFSKLREDLTNWSTEAPPALKLERALEDLPDFLSEAPLGTGTFVSEREAAKRLLERIRWADSLETIQIPDVRPQEDNLWVELELVETNMTGQLTTDLQEYLTAGPTIDRALDAYNEFQSILKSLGVVLPKVADNDLMRLLLAGEDSSVTLNLSKPIDSDGELDHQHTLAVHLTTGTFSVRCSVKPANTAEIAESWAEAQAIASITGKETELQIYAREFARTNDERKTRRLIKARKAGIIAHD